MNDAALFGPRLTSDGVTFRLWAPAARQVELLIDPDKPPGGAASSPVARPMQRGANGWYEATVPGAGAGTLYRFRIDGELAVPDPASPFQPKDVNGPSEVIDHRFDWNTAGWRGRPWQDAVFLELHVGTFTPEGTFRAAIDKLDHVVDAGITAIELLPIADFAGARNWGYDGVLLFAPDSAYGRPEDLKALIDAAHARGLMVFLDVVYNHFGPEGNYLGRYAPSFFTDAATPWGQAIDYRVPQVRAFAFENALHWLRDYRFDGLRLDAVHAIAAPGEPSMLADLSRAVGKLAADSGRLIHLVLENDDNSASLLDPAADPPVGRYRAQWNDDYHHAWHTLLTHEDTGYYRDYADDPFRHLARILASGFAYQGEPSRHRKGAPRGEPSGGLPPTAFVSFLQNHDQIGNRPLGDRLTKITDAPALEAALAVTLLAPMPPLLFMGEEWGATEPFPFFCDFSGDLADAVRKGRRGEFAEAYAKLGDDWPDPLEQETFSSAVLDWSAREREPHRSRLELVRRLLQLRRSEIGPRLAGMKGGSARAQFDASVLSAQWRMGDGSRLSLLANLTSDPVACTQELEGRPIWGGAPGKDLVAWSVHWAIGDA
jgi:maltooligosyltrehalose trehalohydrolase